MGQATQTQSQTPTLEQSLNKTDFGHVLYENRKILLGALLAAVVVVMGWIFWNESKKSTALNNSVKVFEFQSTVWSDAKTGKVAPHQLIRSFTELDRAVQTAPVMVPVVLEMGKFLYEKGAYGEADAILSSVKGTFNHPVPSFFLGMQHAVIQEKLGKLDEAILTLEDLAKNKDVLMPAKVSVDLARMYMAKGEKGKAQTQLEHVLSTYPNDEQAKLAKLYKAQLAQ